MNRVRLSILVLLIFSNLTAFSQGERIEKVYQDCVYNSISKKDSTALKRYIKGFEKHLIALKFLKDSTADSYYKLFKSFPKNKALPESFKYSFIDSLNLIKSLKIIPNNINCSQKITEHKDYENYKNKMEAAIPKDLTKINEGLKNYINLLSVEDFKLDYYKKHTFLMMDILSSIYHDKEFLEYLSKNED